MFSFTPHPLTLVFIFRPHRLLYISSGADKENLIDQQELTKLTIFLSTEADTVKRSWKSVVLRDKIVQIFSLCKMVEQDLPLLMLQIQLHIIISDAERSATKF